MNNIEEATLYYTVNDAIDVVNAIGLNNFLESLFRESKTRPLTIDEIEAMQTLHDSWEL